VVSEARKQHVVIHKDYHASRSVVYMTEKRRYNS
jgi:hypothetical protein